MNTLANDKFDFDDEDTFTEEELADLESLSEEELDLDFDEDFEFEDIDLEDLDEEDWDEAYKEPVAGESSALAKSAEADLPSLQEEQALTDIEDALDISEGDMPESPVAESVENLSFADDDESSFTDDDERSPEEAPADVPSVEAAVSAAGLTADYYEDDVPQDGDHIPVPRINISVFCETQTVSELVEASAADRRLSKAHVTILMGGIKKAVQHFQHESTPNLLIIETINGGQELFDGLSSLAEVCDPSTKVIVIGSINDIRLYRDLMNKGISEYLIAPKTPVQVTRAIASLYVDPSAPPIGRSIVFVGARGGVGSSTICHNVAWAMAERHKSDTVILDLDLAFGTASLDFEQDPSQGLAEALAAPERLDDVLLDRLLQKCTERLSLFAAPNVLDHDYDLPASAFEEVLEMVRKGVPNLVVDLPHAWTSWTRHVLQNADEIVITATPDLSSFRNAKNLIESVKASRTNDAPPYLVLNQMGVPKRPEIPPEQFAEALEIEPTAVINWEPQLFGLAATNAEPIFESGGKSKAVAAVDRLAMLLLGMGGDKVYRNKINLKSLFRKL